MALSEEIVFDAKDAAIASALAGDARAPFKQIARRTRLSWEVVDYRVRKMLESGAIQSFYPNIDFSKIGACTYRVYFKFAGLPGSSEKLFKTLERTRAVEWFCLCSGYWDAIIRVGAKDNSQFAHELEALYDEVGEYVLRQHVGISSFWGIYPPAVWDTQFRERKIFTVDFSQAKTQVDEIDLRVLSSLSDDARKSFQEIAADAGIEAGAARYRFNQLVKKKVLAQFFTAFDYSKLGFERYKIMFTTKQKKTRSLFDYFVGLPNAYFCIKLLGSWDLEADVIVKNSTELYELIQQALRKNADAIRNYETVTIFRDHYNKQDFSYLLK
jgi:Lrp/AsnC family transcriptional regulator for asnA, asnC and gidA